MEKIANAGSTNSANQKTQSKRYVALTPILALLPYLRRYPAMAWGTIVALLAAAMATLALPLGVRQVIDLGFATENSEFVRNSFAMMILLGIVLALASSARFYLVNWLGERIVADLRRDVFYRLATLSPAFYEKTHSGEVMSRLTADTTQIKAAVGVAASQTLRNSLLFLGALVMMFVTSFKLSLLVFFAIPLIVLPLVTHGRFVRKRSRQAQDRLAEASAYAAENLSAVQTMQAFTSERYVVGRFAGAVERSFDAARARMRARASLTAIAIMIVFTSVIAVLWYGSTEVLSGAMSGGQLGQFVLYAIFAAGAMSELSQVWGEVQQAAGAAERLAELLSITPQIQSPRRPISLPKASLGKVAFEGVTFSYPTRLQTKALDSISFTPEPGQLTAIVGPSGAGKSTIFNLLLRFYDPQSGTVRVDGVCTAQADLFALRQRIAMVPQHVALFAASVAENIRYGAPNACDSEVYAVCQAALVDEFVQHFPDGYNTELGEGGVTLSGGQRQRIAIARALLRNAPILLLDEATSALDAESERHVQLALERLMESRTTLVIAHRLATVQNADRILVLDGGKLVQDGTPASLMSENGTYNRLAALQFSPTLAAE